MSEGRATLLWEVGFEELPAWACDQLVAQLPDIVRGQLAESRLEPGEEMSVWVGPRRAAVEVTVAARQRAERVERRGPAYDAAFGADGAPSKACVGFARSAGLTPDQLEVREEGGRRFVWAIADAPSHAFGEVFPDIARDVLTRLNFGKLMRWGAGEHRFVRPVRWVVTKLDGDTVEYDLYGVSSSAASRTHRFLGPSRTLDIDHAVDYARTLASGHVITDQSERRTRIERGLEAAAREIGGEWFDPGGVLREVVHLVEWPTVITGRFDEAYLNLPERVLVTAMQSHQRYLPVRVGDRLAPAFLAAMNGDPAHHERIVAGYERVLVGRLDDAVFSFDRDRARGLDDMASSLGAVVFHAKAGSLADRTERIRAIARAIAAQCIVDDALAQRLDDATRLAKADQVSVLVQEFAELEGFAGRLYAADAGYDDVVCTAIDQQFLPKGPSTSLPDEGVPALLALADRFDLLATCFAIGEQPTGSRDPHGLRRAALGVMRIVLAYDLPIDVGAVLRVAADMLTQQGYGDPNDEVLHEIGDFLDDRLEKHLTGDGVRIDAVRAARPAQRRRLQQLEGLARAIDRKIASGDERFHAVLTALNRCSRIVDKARKDDVAIAGIVDASRFESAAEGALSGALDELAAPLATAVEEERYDDAVERAAMLNLAVQTFFDRDTGVMVMADDAMLRANRLALVQRVVDTLAPLGDLTQLQVG